MAVGQGWALIFTVIDRGLYESVKGGAPPLGGLSWVLLAALSCAEAESPANASAWPFYLTDCPLSALSELKLWVKPIQAW